MKAIIAFTILAGYAIMECLLYGIPKSLSQSWFSIVHKWIFSAIMVVASVLLFMTLMEILPQLYQCLGFLCCAGGVLIGFAPNLNDEVEHSVHMLGATLLALCSQIIVLLLCPHLLLAWIVTLPVIFLCSECVVFWIEIVGGVLIFLSIFLSL